MQFKRFRGEPCHIEGIQAGTDQYNCVPNVVTSVSVWLYCPNVVVGSCVKTTIDVPMSCSCVRFNCPYSLVDTAVAPSPGQGKNTSEKAHHVTSTCNLHVFPLQYNLTKTAIFCRTCFSKVRDRHLVFRP